MPNTLYVSKSGLDTNPGTSEAPKLTINAGVAASAPGDILMVRSGVYREQVVHQKNSLIKADGRVIIDGENLRQHCLYLRAGGKFEGITLQNALTSLVRIQAVYSHEWRNMEFLAAPAVTPSTVPANNSKFYNCLFAGLTSTTLPAFKGRDLEVYNCTFENLATTSGGVYSVNGSLSLFQNVFSRCPMMWTYLAGGLDSTFAADYNAYDFPGGGKVHYLGTTYTSLSGFTAVATTEEINSESLTPDLNDTSKALYGPVPGGTVAAMGPTGGPVGASRLAYGFSSNRNGTVFSGGVFSNTEYTSGTVNITLTEGNTTGTWTSPVVNLGEVYRLKGIRLSTLFDNYPEVGAGDGEVIDSDNTDSNPNRHTVEYRYSKTSFTTLSVLPWLTAERTSIHTLSIAGDVRAQYVQVRITFRNNGVAT